MSNVFNLPIEIERTETGYVATSPLLPGLVVDGLTIEEVYREAPIVAQELIQIYKDAGKPLPPELEENIDKLSLSILVPA
ncbi:MAG: type II toxin-antitoxin system HicB family antitoxin [Anaerolineae bacterium]|nr:type II toxin-antitoxin system HicB family antitoxin [Anaerolineae bacterium]